MIEFPFSGTIFKVVESHKIRDCYTLIGLIGVDQVRDNIDIKIHFLVNEGHKILECLIDDFIRSNVYNIKGVFKVYEEEQGKGIDVSGEIFKYGHFGVKEKRYEFIFSPRSAKVISNKILNLEDEVIEIFAPSYEIAYVG